MTALGHENTALEPIIDVGFINFCVRQVDMGCFPWASGPGQTRGLGFPGLSSLIRTFLKFKVTLLAMASFPCSDGEAQRSRPQKLWLASFKIPSLSRRL